MSRTIIKWDTTTNNFGEHDKPTSRNTLTFVSYANHQAIKIYRDLSVNEVTERFHAFMDSRTEREIEHEGWEAAAMQIDFQDSDEAHLFTNDLLLGPINKMLAELFGQQFA